MEGDYNMEMMKKFLVLMLSMVLILMVTACGGNPGSGEDTITIYDGEFAEMQLIHYMVKLMVEEHTGAKVAIKDQMSPVNSFNELVKGSSDLMNSYDGTLLTTFLHLDPSDVPEGTTLYDFVNEQGRDRGVRLLDKLGFNNTYILAVPQRVARQYDNVSTVSDLIPISGELVFGAEHDFFTEEGSAKFNPLTEYYGLNFKEAKQIDINLKYSAIDSDNIDVTVAYATDGRNIKYQLKLLEDDRNFFPEYNGALLVRYDLFERLEGVAPNLEEVLNRLGGAFSNESMASLSYEVDIEGRAVAEVAEEFLREAGLLS